MSTLFAASLPPPSLDLLLAWFRARDIAFDARLAILTASPGDENNGWSVLAMEDIDVEQIVCRIPKQAIFSPRNSSLAKSKACPTLSPLTSPTFSLALHLLHECLLGSSSPWWPYLQSLPRSTVPLAMLWEGHAGVDGERAWTLAKGGEVGWRVRRDERPLGWERGVPWGAGGLAALRAFFDARVLPTIAASAALRFAGQATPPSFATFLHVYSLVSSRSFHVDEYHQVALVPLADLFNHSPDNAVNPQIDPFVCHTCGSLLPCAHDAPPSSGIGLPSRLAHLGEFEERDLAHVFGEGDSIDMIVCGRISRGDEVFNSYGDLSSFKLLTDYGFVIPSELLALPTDIIHLPLPSSSPPLQLANAHISISHPWLCDPRLYFSDASISPTPDDMSFVSPDAQLSVPFLVALAATPEAGSLTPEAAVSAIQAGVGEAWEVLRLAVARSLKRRLEEGYLVDETLWLLTEDRSKGPLERLAARVAGGERAVLDVCLRRWENGDVEEDEDEEDNEDRHE